jgi:hypothetical protein
LILDTTYFLPLAQISVDTDLLAAVAKKKTDLRLQATFGGSGENYSFIVGRKELLRICSLG